MVKQIKTKKGTIKAKIVPQSNTNIDNILQDYIKKFKSEYINGIRLALANPSIGELLVVQCIDILNRMQDRYWGGASSIVEEDPTQLGLPEQHQKARIEILKNLQEASNTVTEDGEFSLTIMTDSFMGTGMDSKGTDGIPWLHYFLEGALDSNLVWINTEVYSKLNTDEGQVQLGRFGVGHMWHIVNIEGFNSRLKAAGLDESTYNYSSLKHPQSGQKGQPWFSDVVRQSGIVERVRDFAIDFANNRMK